MKSVFVCRSCGFVSTLGSAFKREQGVLVCIDCKSEYGQDADVTRWVNSAVSADASKSETTVV